MRLVVGAGLVLAVASAPLPASAAAPGPGADVVAAREAWQAAGAAAGAAGAGVAAAGEERDESRAAAAEAAAQRDREHERLVAARAALDAARRAAEDAGRRVRADADERGDRDGPMELPSGGSLRPGEGTSAAAADLAERHEQLQALARTERVDPELALELAAAVSTRAAAEAAHADQEAVHAAAASTARARAEDAVAADAALASAEHRLEERTAEHVESLAAFRGLGWRAGVPGRHGWVWPTDGRPGSRFGPRRHPITGTVRLHAGVDVPAPTGQAVLAAAAGTVTFAGMRGGYGFTVDVDHGQGRLTRYAHLSYIHVREGDRVGQSQRIARVGSTGASTGPHLHWEVRVNGVPRDPLGSFPKP